MWECAWTAEGKNNQDVNNFLAAYDDPPVLRPRDALKGGRTNAIRLHYKAKEGEKILHYDFTSLYPYVQIRGCYPSGEFTQIVENFDYTKEYFGIATVRVLPPRGLFFPILPQHLDKKLVFALCQFCASRLQDTACTCSDEKRAMTGTFTTPELYLAVENGYKILKYFEVWHYEKSEKYDPETRSGGIFTDYLKLLVKEKVEASGFPAGTITEAQKDQYIKDYFDNEGIQLEKDKIKHNAGMRTTAKTALNAMWG